MEQFAKFNERTEFPQTKKFTTPEGTKVVMWDGKLHSWDEPALIPEGEYKKREYYLYGVRYSEEDWKQAKREWTGVPYYKDPRFNVRN
jgi:hypothetical protein